jgi:quercetin dioxygenase-like cupin family protein
MSGPPIPNPERVAWQPFGDDGTSFALLRRHEDGGAVLFSRFPRGTRGRRHAHPGGEDLLVVSGRCRVDGISLRAGDYLHTPPGASHALVADEDTVLFLILPRAPIYQDETAPREESSR